MFRVVYRLRKCDQKSQKVAGEAWLQCFLHCRAWKCKYQVTEPHNLLITFEALNPQNLPNYHHWESQDSFLAIKNRYQISQKHLGPLGPGLLTSCLWRPQNGNYKGYSLQNINPGQILKPKKPTVWGAYMCIVSTFSVIVNLQFNHTEQRKWARKEDWTFPDAIL